MLDRSKENIEDIKIESIYDKSIKFIKENKASLVLGALLTGSLYQHYQYTPLVIEREVQKNDVILFDAADKDLMVIDLKSMYTIKTEEVNSKDGSTKIKVARGLEMDNGRSIYLTVFEPKEKQVLNK